LNLLKLDRLPLAKCCFFPDNRGIGRSLDFISPPTSAAHRELALSASRLRRAARRRREQNRETFSGKLEIATFFKGISALGHNCVAADGSDFSNQVWTALSRIPARKDHHLR